MLCFRSFFVIYLNVLWTKYIKFHWILWWNIIRKLLWIRWKACKASIIDFWVLLAYRIRACRTKKNEFCDEFSPLLVNKDDSLFCLRVYRHHFFDWLLHWRKEAMRNNNNLNTRMCVPLNTLACVLFTLYFATCQAFARQMMRTKRKKQHINNLHECTHICMWIHMWVCAKRAYVAAGI